MDEGELNGLFLLVLGRIRKDARSSTIGVRTRFYEKQR